MSKSRPSLTKQVNDRLYSMYKPGTGKRALKRQVREAHPKPNGKLPWSVSTGLIHSDNTLTAYKRIMHDYANWARERHGVRHLEDLDARAGELATAYLRMRRREGKSACTLAQDRAAIRMLHRPALDYDQVKEVGRSAKIGRRRREDIRNNRREGTAYSRHCNDANHPDTVTLLEATGLRRREAEALRVAGVEVRRDRGDLSVVVHVANGKGGKQRDIPVQPDKAEGVAALVDGRDGSEHVVHVPRAMRIHVYRRGYAQALYVELSGRELPNQDQPLRWAEQDVDAAREVSRRLGHERIDVIGQHYIR